jgi:hypothetical protein
MRADDLTKAQCAALRNKASEMVAYLYRLNRRMGEKGLPEDDPLQLAVARALSAMSDLHAEVTGRSIDGMDRQASGEKPAAIDPLFTRTSKPRKHEC